jgi:hypothetical protein
MHQILSVSANESKQNKKEAENTLEYKLNIPKQQWEAEISASASIS